MGSNSPRGRYDFEDIPRLNALLDHDLLLNWVANKHIDWTNATDNLLTTGSGRFDGGVKIGANLTLLSDATYIYFSGDGNEATGTTIAVPKGAQDFYYGLGGTKHHYFGCNSEAEITDDGEIYADTGFGIGVGGTLHLVTGADFVALTGDGEIQEIGGDGLQIAVPLEAGTGFYYGFRGTEHHYFGNAGNVEITDDGNIATAGTIGCGAITSVANTLNLGDNSSANDTVINFLSSGNDGDITYDQTDDEFDFGDADITTVGLGTFGTVKIGTALTPDATHLLVVGNPTNNTFFGIGQSADYNYEMGWAYNATPTLAYGQIVTFGYRNDFRINAKNIILQDASGGKVGINEVSPQDTLEVNGTVLVKDKLKFTQDDGNEFIDSLNDGYIDYGATTAHRFDAPVGIGTTAPDSIFHIKANVPGTVGSHPAGQLIIQDPDDTVFGNAVITGYESDGAGNPDQQLWYLGSSSSGNSNIIFLNRRNSKLQLGTSGSARMTILGNGNVGIGTATPATKFDINADSVRVKTSQTPASDGAGVQGEIAWDADYIYVCTATNTWKRASLGTWAVTDVLLLDDGASKLLLDDGSSFLLIRL